MRKGKWQRGEALRNGLVECGAGASAGASTDMKNNQLVPWWGQT